MTISDDDDRPTEPTDSNATRDRPTETIEYVAQLDSSLIDGVERDRAEGAPVFLLPDRRRSSRRALLPTRSSNPDSLQQVLRRTFPKERSRRIRWAWPEDWSRPEP